MNEYDLSDAGETVLHVNEECN